MKPTLKIPISPAKQNLTPEPSVEEREKIRLRAFELYEARGHKEGHELEDWLQAEAEVINKPVAA
jgi:hypothetical protein